jgi:hypothetical protein
MIAAIKSVLRTIGFMKDSPLTTRQQLYDFIDSRAAFVSQVTLYTYVKARAGTQYPKLFQDADFLTSLRIARWHIYGAAICDLGLFAIAQLKRDGGLNDEAAQDLAIECWMAFCWITIKMTLTHRFLPRWAIPVNNAPPLPIGMLSLMGQRLFNRVRMRFFGGRQLPMR